MAAVGLRPPRGDATVAAMVRLTDLPDFSGSSLDALAQWARSDAPPPVERWNPAHCGTIDIRIAGDGRWFHEGRVITRPAMVRLFSRVLRREEDGSFVLVTPAEKMSIVVEDAPFLAVEMKQEGEGADTRLAFRLNTGEVVVADAQHPLVLREGPAGLLPYLHVRTAGAGVLEARLARPVYYALAELADAHGKVCSAGQTFTIGEVAE